MSPTLSVTEAPTEQSNPLLAALLQQLSTSQSASEASEQEAQQTRKTIDLVCNQLALMQTQVEMLSGQVKSLEEARQADNARSTEQMTLLQERCRQLEDANRKQSAELKSVLQKVERHQGAIIHCQWKVGSTYGMPLPHYRTPIPSSEYQSQ